MLLFIWARPPRFLLEPAHARPRATPLPPRSHCHRGPHISARRASVRIATHRPCAPRSGHGWLGHGHGAACRSGPGPTTAPAPRGTPMAGPPHSPLLFPSLPRHRSSRSNITEPLVHFPVTNSSPAPLSSIASLSTVFRAHTAASGHRRPLPRVEFCRAPPLSSPSPVSTL
jgi:hypothetical protein